MASMNVCERHGLDVETVKRIERLVQNGELVLQPDRWSGGELRLMDARNMPVSDKHWIHVECHSCRTGHDIAVPGEGQRLRCPICQCIVPAASATGFIALPVESVSISR